ncbi:MAG: hypothetical protein R3F11_08920 [Verrucomicrobiales bacterium]
MTHALAIPENPAFNRRSAAIRKPVRAQLSWAVAQFLHGISIALHGVYFQDVAVWLLFHGVQLLIQPSAALRMLEYKIPALDLGTNHALRARSEAARKNRRPIIGSR